MKNRNNVVGNNDIIDDNDEKEYGDLDEILYIDDKLKNFQVTEDE